MDLSQAMLRKEPTGKSTASPYPFLCAIAGRSPEDTLLAWLAQNPRLKKYLFYEFIASPEQVRRFRDDPRMREDIDKAILWYTNYQTLFEREGKPNPELLALATEWKTRVLDWKDWFSDRHVFMKGLMWQEII